MVKLNFQVGYMSEETNVEICIAEINRFYKYYQLFCKSPDPDSLREVLSYAYSVNEKLRKQKITNFFSSPYYLAIQALRNYAIHQSELFNISKALPIDHFAKLNAEVAIMCLLPRKVIDDILTGKLKNETKKAINESFIFYQKYVDIYPCIFNFGVTLYFEIKKLQLKIQSPEFKAIEKFILYEKSNNFNHYIKKSNNFNHYINGNVSTIDGSSIDSFIDTSLISLFDYSRIQDSLQKDENGMTTFISSRKPLPEEWFHLKSDDECIDILYALIQEGKVQETSKGPVKSFKCVTDDISMNEKFLVDQFNKFYLETYGGK
jgi:hypothetical protein